MNEHVRTINNMIEINMFKREAYLHQLEEALDQVTMQECKTLMERVKECRHQKVLERQKKKFEALVLKSNGRSKQDV